MSLYERHIETYKANERRWKKIGFTLPIAAKILKICALKPIDAYYLFAYARQIPDGGTYLEIGSWIGGSFLCAYEGTRQAGHSVKFIGIEPGGGNLLLENIKNIPRLRLIRSYSDRAKNLIKDKSIDLLFIDGNHRSPQVDRDFLHYWPKIKIGGVLLGHDYSGRQSFDVKPAADKIFGEKLVKLPNDSTIFKVEKNEIIRPKDPRN